MARRSSQRRFSVSLDDAELTFNAAHFVAFPLAVPSLNVDSFAFDAATRQVVHINNDDVLATATTLRPASEPAWIGEPIHGHDFRVSIRVEGPRDASGCVLDFVAARRALLEIAADWNHRTILATRAPETEYREIPPTPDNPVGEIVVLWRGAPEPRRWVLPSDAVAWIDALNASTEELASVLLDYWLEKLVENGALPFPTAEYRFSLRLEESPGAFAEVALG
jgi:6-pyruvoyltetrahydropterin/6-carboxytetrahydropterin synthase